MTKAPTNFSERGQLLPASDQAARAGDAVALARHLPRQVYIWYLALGTWHLRCTSCSLMEELPAGISKAWTLCKCTLIHKLTSEDAPGPSCQLLVVAPPLSWH